MALDSALYGTRGKKPPARRTAGAPAAVMVTQFTQMYRTEGEAQFASAVNIMTSVLCLATMPVISWLYQTLAY